MLIFDHKHQIKADINSIRLVGTWINHKPMILLDREQGMLGKTVTVGGHLDLQGAEGHIMKHMPCAHGCTSVCVCVCRQSGCLSVHLIK